MREKLLLPEEWYQGTDVTADLPNGQGAPQGLPKPLT